MNTFFCPFPPILRPLELDHPVSKTRGEVCAILLQHSLRFFEHFFRRLFPDLVVSKINEFGKPHREILGKPPWVTSHGSSGLFDEKHQQNQQALFGSPLGKFEGWRSRPVVSQNKGLGAFPARFVPKSAKVDQNT